MVDLERQTCLPLNWAWSSVSGEAYAMERWLDDLSTVFSRAEFEKIVPLQACVFGILREDRSIFHGPGPQTKLPS